MREREPVKALLALIAVWGIVVSGLLAMFWPIFEDPETLRFFGIADAWVYTGAGQSFIDQMVHSGEFPLWNPLVFCGQPIAGNPQYLLFYPPNLVRSVLTVDPTPWRTMVGLAILAFSHGVLAATGAYAFGRFHGVSRPGAAFAGVAFVFSSALMQRFFLHHHIFFVIAWLPWNLLAMDWAADAATRYEALRRYCVLGIVFAMTILAGSPQLTYFVAITMVLYWLFRSIERLVREFRIGWIRREIAGGVTAVLAAIGLSAALIVPAIEFMEGTQRLGPDTAQLELDPSRESENFREALLFYPGGAPEGIKGIGASAAVLCVLGLFSRLRRHAILFALLAAVLLSASRIDSQLMLRVIGGWAPFPISSPGRLSIVAAFPLAMLAGLGVDRLLHPIEWRAGRIALAGVCIASALVVIETLYSYSLTSVRFAGVPIIWSLLFPIVSAGAAVTAIIVPGWRWAAALAVVTAMGEPLFWQGVRMRELASRERPFASISLDTARQMPSMWAGNERDSLLMPNSALYSLRGQMNGYDPLQLFGYTQLAGPPTPNAFWRGIIQVTRWSDRPYLLMKRAFWLHRGYVAGEIPPRGQLFPVSTITYVSNAEGLHAAEIAASEAGRHPYSRYVVRFPILAEPLVFESTGAVDGPAHLVTVPVQPSDVHPSLLIVVSSTETATLHVHLPEKASRRASRIVASIELSPRLVSGEFDIPLPDADLGQVEFTTEFPDTTGVITIEQAEIVLDQADENWRIRILERRANSVEVEIAGLDDYRILSHIDFSYRGWRAFVDGQPARLLNTFSYFKGVEVPPGTHRVRFEFRPFVAYAGIAISILSALFFLAGIVWTLATGRARSGGEAINDSGA